MSSLIQMWKNSLKKEWKFVLDVSSYRIEIIVTYVGVTCQQKSGVLSPNVEQRNGD